MLRLLTPREQIDQAYAAYQKLLVIKAMGNDRFVPGEGPLDAPLMFIGEAPGEKEDEDLRPFSPRGRSGELLRRLMREAGINPDDCYITNIVKMRPERNRTPYVFELHASRPCLHAEILAIRPMLIVTLGIPALSGGFGFPARTLHDNYGQRMDLTLDESAIEFGLPAGQVLDEASTFTCKLMPLYHPSYILRSGQEDRMLAELRKI